MQLRRKPIAAAITGGITDGLTGTIVGAAAANQPLFQELFTDATNDTNFTNTRATPQYVPTDTGALYPVPGGAIPIRNARPVRNLVLKPTDLGTSYTYSIGYQHVKIAVSAGVSDPAGGNNAFTVTATDANGLFYHVPVAGDLSIKIFASSIWVRRRTGTGRVDFITPAIGTINVTSVITSEWQRISFSSIGHTSQTRAPYFVLTTSGDAIDVFLPQLQDITHRAALSTAPDEFIDPDTDYGTGVNGFRYFTTALANTVDGSGVVTEATGAALTGIALANVPGATNLADGTHDFSGGADTITLSATGYYTLWLQGTAQVTIAAGTATITGAGSATEGSPVTINCTATGTVTLTLDSGTLDEVNGSQVIMLESGTVPTAFIPTDGSTASTDAAVLDFSGVTGFTTPNETRVVATGLNASLEADPTDTTERNVDADDWDGTDLSDLVPHGNIISVTQYAPGERP